MIKIWDFPADRIYREQLNPVERVNHIRHPINLRLFNWRVSALITTDNNEMQLQYKYKYLYSHDFPKQDIILLLEKPCSLVSHNFYTI